MTVGDQAKHLRWLARMQLDCAIAHAQAVAWLEAAGVC